MKFMKKIRAALAVSLVLVTVLTLAVLPTPVFAAALILAEGNFSGEVITRIPSWYLRQLRGNTTNDALLWSDLSAAEQAQVTAELAYRVAGTSEPVESLRGVDAVSGAATALTITGGAGVNGSGSTSGTAGGAVTVTSGAAGTTGTGTGGAGGAASLVAAAGGAASGAGTGGAGGAIALTGAAGGATTTSVGGAGSDITLTSGAGGGASGAGTGGAGGTIVLVNGIGGVTVGGTDGIPGMVRVGGVAGANAFGLNVVRSTITSAAEVTVAQMRGMVLYSDATGGNTSFNTVTGTAMSAAFPDAAVGTGIVIYVVVAGANTLTVTGDTDFTLVGSGAVTTLGGTFLAVKTAATTWDLLRVG